MAQKMSQGVVKTSKGVYLDMNKVSRENPTEIAMTGGGLSMNARGDILGRGGKIIKTREELERAYNAANAKATKHVTDRPVSIKKTNISPDNLPEEVKLKLQKPEKKTAPEKEELSLEDVSSVIEEKEEIARRKRKTTTDEK